MATAQPAPSTDDNQLAPASVTPEVSALSTSTEAVVMQTATAQLVHPTTHLEQEARILFDSGSYRTYVTQDLADSLQLTIEGQEHISVMTFSCSKVQQITASTTVLHLKLADGSVFPITASVVPKITGAITRTTLPAGLFQTWKHLWAKTAFS